MLHMHPGKSLDTCILLLDCVYGAQGGVSSLWLVLFYTNLRDIVGVDNLACKTF